MVAEYLGKLFYRNGKPLEGFLVGMRHCIDDIVNMNKKIIVTGVGENGFLAVYMLERQGAAIYGYADNNEKLQGKRFMDKTIYSPYQIFSEDYYYIIAVNLKNINYVRLQFMVHGIRDYSVFLTNNFHDFTEEDRELQTNILDQINYICFEGEREEEALPMVGLFLGGDGSQLGILNWLLKSTEWSHFAYLWGKDFISGNEVDYALEIGPGYGLMSSVLIKYSEHMRIDWLLYGERENQLAELKREGYAKGLLKVKNKYKDRISENWDYIEKDDCQLGNEKYDLIIITEVFEHFVCNPVKTIEKCQKALKKNGRMILTTPNWGHLHLYKNWSDMPDICAVSDERYKELSKCGHAYQYSKGELDNIFEQANLKIFDYQLSDSNNHNYLLGKPS